MTQALRVAFTDTFSRDQRRFAQDRALLADLALTINEICQQPFGNPRLQTHRVRQAQNGVMTSYVGNQQHRVIWFKAGQTAVLLLFDRHDEAYRRAVRLQVEVAGEGSIEITERTGSERAAGDEVAPAAHAGPAPFDPWDDRLLASAGFAEHEINLLRDARDEDAVLRLQRYLAPATFERALQVLAATSEEEVRQLGVEPPAELEPSPEEEQLAVAVEQRVAGAHIEGVAVVDAEDIETVFTRPIEDWMVFLHPEQRRLVERRFNGPARITGGAGTGKTVVGVHRAARLAAEGRKVLFTTYIRTLPGVLEALYERLSPETCEFVSFVGVHAQALRLVRGSDVRVDPQQADAAFDEAWRRAASHGSLLRGLGLGKQYFRDEIAWIIKGRGLTADDHDAYLASPRTGRGTPFPREVREEIWPLFLLYERRLRARNTVDFDDVLRVARDQLRDSPDGAGFDAVIVDEAQDLTRVGLEFLAALAGDREDGLLLLGDGQQSLYPGGHSLGSIGIDVRGRSVVLRLNYRSTRQILEVANRIVAGRPFDDGDAELQVADPIERIEVERTGAPPTLNAFDSVDDHDESLLLHIERLAARDDTGLGDIAVLIPTNALVRGYAARISDLGMACQPLDRYDGRPSEEVKVGTFKRAKGLEFKHVLIPRAEPETLRETPLSGEDAATHTERVDRLRRELFVAVTRARDTVWIGHVGEPSGLLGTSDRGVGGRPMSSA